MEIQLGPRNHKPRIEYGGDARRGCREKDNAGAVGQDDREGFVKALAVVAQRR